MRSLCLLLLGGALIAPVQAAVLTVGPNGTYSNLNDALQVAASNGADDNIRIQQGLHVVQAVPVIQNENRYLEISGGWNADFSGGVEDPATTILTGTDSARVLDITLNAGELQMNGFTLTRGRATSGGALLLNVRQQARATLRSCVIRDSQATGAAIAAGGGARILVDGGAEIQVISCTFMGNRSSAGTARGGALSVYMADGAFLGSNLIMGNNEAVGGQAAYGGALHIETGEVDPTIALQAMRVDNNRVQAPLLVRGSGAYVSLPAASPLQLRIEGSSFDGNQESATSSTSAQLHIEAATGTVRLLSLALIDGVVSGGLSVNTTGAAQAMANNLTTAGNAGIGLRFVTSAATTGGVGNLVSFGNGAGNLVTTQTGSAGLLQTFNHIDSDPGVVDAAAGNYRLRADSIAVDSGFPQLLGGLGTIDADRRQRLSGANIDRGAYEYVGELVFRNGFETP